MHLGSSVQRESIKSRAVGEPGGPSTMAGMQHMGGQKLEEDGDCLEVKWKVSDGLLLRGFDCYAKESGLYSVNSGEPQRISTLGSDVIRVIFWKENSGGRVESAQEQIKVGSKETTQENTRVLHQSKQNMFLA